jgi:hypothetical protein
MEDNYYKQNNKVKFFTLCIFCSFWFAGALTYSFYDGSVICNYNCPTDEATVKCIDNCTTSLNNYNTTIAFNSSIINSSIVSYNRYIR